MTVIFIIPSPQHQLCEVSLHSDVFSSPADESHGCCSLLGSAISTWCCGQSVQKLSQWVFLWLSSPETSPTCRILLSFERSFLWPPIHCRSRNWYLGDTEMWEDLSDSRWGWRRRHKNPPLSVSPWATYISHPSPQFSCADTGSPVCRWDLIRSLMTGGVGGHSDLCPAMESILLVEWEHLWSDLKLPTGFRSWR